MTLPSCLYDCFDKIKYNVKESFSFIFYHNFDYIRSLHDSGKMSSSTFQAVLNTILCGSVFLGFDLFVCPHCDKETIVPHSCKSRLCSKCGVKSAKERAAFVSSMAVDSNHRHLVFTIPQELRVFFAKDKDLLHLLFIAARNTITNVANNQKFRKNRKRISSKTSSSPYFFKDIKHPIVLGAITSLHTFGRDLKYNPHIHMLLSEEAYDSKNDSLKNISFLPYQKLRKTWMYEVLSLLRQYLGPDFQELKTDLYDICEEGFYVHAPKNNKDTEEEDVDACISYMTRYTSRPAMAESRIQQYHPESHEIQWFYDDHKTEERIEVKESVHDFLNKLFIHCPKENFKMIRYYGFYSNAGRAKLDRMYELLGQKKKKEHRTWKQRQEVIHLKKIHTTFRFHMIESICKDPLLCSCGHFMEFHYSYIPTERGNKIDQRYKERCLSKMDEWGGFERRRDPDHVR